MQSESQCAETVQYSAGAQSADDSAETLLRVQRYEAQRHDKFFADYESAPLSQRYSRWPLDRRPLRTLRCADPQWNHDHKWALLLLCPIIKQQLVPAE